MMTVVEMISSSLCSCMRLIGLKIYALLASSFDEIGYYDVDAFPMRDPTEMFEHPMFQKNGAVFWFDKTQLPPLSKIWSFLGISPYGTVSQDSCMLFLKKSMCWRALLTVGYMNTNQRFFYSMLYGDKDTFALSFIYTGHSYVFVPGSLGQLGPNTSSIPSASSGQHDFEGRLFAIHDNMYRRDPKFRFETELRKMRVANLATRVWRYSETLIVISTTGTKSSNGAPNFVDYDIDKLISFSLKEVDDRYYRFKELANGV